MFYRIKQNEAVSLDKSSVINRMVIEGANGGECVTVFGLVGESANYRPIYKDTNPEEYAAYAAFIESCPRLIDYLTDRQRRDEDSHYREGAQHVLQVVKMAAERGLPADQWLSFIAHYSSQIEEWFASDVPGQPPSGYGALGEAFARADKSKDGE